MQDPGHTPSPSSPPPKALSWNSFGRWMFHHFLSWLQITLLPGGSWLSCLGSTATRPFGTVRISFHSDPLPINFSFLLLSLELQPNFIWICFQCFHCCSKLLHAKVGCSWARYYYIESYNNLFPFCKTFSPSKSHSIKRTGQKFQHFLLN